MRRLVPLSIAAAAVACGTVGSSPEHGAARRTTQALEATVLDGTTLADKRLVLTFDDGPGEVTAGLSTWLAGRPEPIRATFFVDGACIATVPAALGGNESCATPTPGAAATIAQLAAEGHVVANHGTTRRDMVTEVPDAQRATELSFTDGLIGAQVPWNRLFYRAPEGSWSAAVHATLAATPMTKYVGPVGWDIGGPAADEACWTASSTTKACGDLYLAEIRTKGHGIVLFHDRAGDTLNHALESGTGNTADLVKYIVPILEGEGFGFARLEDVPAIATVLPGCDASCAACDGPTASECTTCPLSRWFAAGACNPCTTCAPGSYASTACAANADAICTACTACADGSFASTACTPLADRTCTTCTTCQPGFYEVSTCGADADRVCGACHESCASCVGPELADCRCLEGTFASELGCLPCTPCYPGSFFVGACTPTQDTACDFCVRGTFSGEGATSCSTCPEGTYAAFPAATGCAECGTCDDEDRCTTDSCTVTQGCVHAPIAGCVARTPAPPGVIDDDQSYAPAGTGDDDADTSGCAAAPRAARSSTALGRFALLVVLVVVAVLGRRRRRVDRGSTAA